MIGRAVTAAPDREAAARAPLAAPSITPDGSPLAAGGQRATEGGRRPAGRAMVRGMPLPPALSADQRQAALEKAAVARRLRAELKEKLKMGSISLSDLLRQADTDEVVGKMKVLSVLESLPGLGKVKARRLMDEVGISETRRLHGLGDQQRKKLFEKLNG